MNREIKFRAWDDKDKEMRNWEDLIIEKDKGCERFSIGYKFNPWITNYDHKHELMQYTGLKDSNGVEIYEGDILTSKAHIDNSEVIFHNCAFLDYDGSETISLIENHETVKVIGNIYENPELLK